MDACPRRLISTLGLLLVLPACPGDDGETDTQSATSGATESGSTVSPSSSDDGTSEAPTGTSENPTTTEDPPPTSSTSDGAESSSSSTAGGGECETNVSQSKECDACSHENCCAEVQACFGDETTKKDTPCLELNNCIAAECTDVKTLDELEACVDANCADVAAELDAYLALNQCQGNFCQEVCF